MDTGYNINELDIPNLFVIALGAGSDVACRRLTEAKCERSGAAYLDAIVPALSPHCGWRVVEYQFSCPGGEISVPFLEQSK